MFQRSISRVREAIPSIRYGVTTALNKSCIRFCIEECVCVGGEWEKKVVIIVCILSFGIVFAFISSRLPRSLQSEDCIATNKTTCDFHVFNLIVLLNECIVILSAQTHSQTFICNYKYISLNADKHIQSSCLGKDILLSLPLCTNSIFIHFQYWSNKRIFCPVCVYVYTVTDIN